MFPKARKKDLIIEHIDEETLIYDLKTDRAHCLNRSASLVWRYCDGKTPLPKMTKRLALATGAPQDDNLVRLALQSLQKANLIDEKSVALKDGPRVSRRELIKTIGKAAAVTLPLVTSIVAPEAAQAASCVPKTWCGKARTDGRCCCDAGPCNQAKGTCAKSGACF
jgi:hypothetical protein